MLKAVIFDLNGVFVKGPKLTERLQKDFRVPEEESLVAFKAVMGKIRLPNAGDVFGYWLPYFQKWGIALSREAFLSYWFGAEEAVSEMFLLAGKLKELGLKIFIFSNNFLERTDYYNRHFPQLEVVADGISYSWQTGLLKTDPRAYQKVLQDNNLKPGDCVFFDDSEENIKVARELGIPSYLFVGVEDTKTRIETALH